MSSHAAIPEAPCRVPSPSPFGSNFFRRWRDNVSPRDAAAQPSLTPHTVQRLFARFRRLGRAGVAPGYPACGQRQPARAPAEQVELFCRTRREHPPAGGRR